MGTFFVVFVSAAFTTLLFTYLRTKKFMQAKVHMVRIKERVRFTPHLIKVVLRTVDPTMAPMYLNIMKMGG